MGQISSEPALPRTLFKYRALPKDGLGFVADILQRGELFFAPATAFNDPFDSAPHLSVKAEPKIKRRYFESQARANGYMPYQAAQMADRMLNQPVADLEQMGRDALANALSHMGICSLAARNDHILLWSHYASDHRGVCLAFDVTRGGFRRYGPFPVEYCDVRPTYNVFDDTKTGLFPTMLIKAKFWAYEEEWRLVSTDDPGPGAKLIEPDCLSAIYLGCAISDEHRQQVLSLAAGRSPPTPVFQMKTSRRTFELERQRIG